MRKLFLRGGLGNQLFQFSFMHHFSFAPHEKFEIWMVDQGRQDRPFNLSPMIPQCRHVSNSFQASDPTGSEGLLFKSVTFFQVEGKLLRESKEYTYELFETSQYDGVFGFFENSRYVIESWSSFGPELMLTFEKIENLSPLIPVDEYIAIHFRRGDFITHNPFGLLDKEYYVRAIDKIPLEERARLPIFGFTDDVDNVRELAAELGIFQLFGPETSTAWQALKAMTKAKYLVSANSTLSWWAAYIASISGRHSFIPRPWFPNWDENIIDCLEFPGANIIPSFFEGR